MRRLLSARVPGGRESAAPLAAAASSPPGFAPAAFFKDGPLGPSSGVYGALECTDTTADSSFEGSFGASFARRVASAAVEGPASSFVEQRGIEGLFSVDSLADASSLKKNSVPAAAFAAMPPPTSTSTQLPGVAASAAAECLDFQSRGLLSAEATGALLSEGDATHVVDSLISRGWRPDTQELALRQQGLGDSACEIIASFLRRTPTVKRLDLSVRSGHLSRSVCFAVSLSLFADTRVASLCLSGKQHFSRGTRGAASFSAWSVVAARSDFGLESPDFG